jgi:transposase
MGDSGTSVAVPIQDRAQTRLADARSHHAIFLVLRGGCPQRMLPQHVLPHQTTYAWFARFHNNGT